MISCCLYVETISKPVSVTFNISSRRMPYPTLLELAQQIDADEVDPDELVSQTGFLEVVQRRADKHVYLRLRRWPLQRP